MKEIKSNEEIKALNKSIYEYYKNTGDLVSAIKYSLNSGEYNEAIKMITKEFPAQFDDLRYRTLWDWLTLIPEEFVLKNDLLKKMKKF